MPATDSALVVPARYCGPTSSGNGGYTAGVLARALLVPVVLVLYIGIVLICISENAGWVLPAAIGVVPHPRAMSAVFVGPSSTFASAVYRFTDRLTVSLNMMAAQLEDLPEDEGEFIAQQQAAVDATHRSLDGEHVVGAVLCGHDGRRGFVYHLAVAERCRGVGIGRAVMRRSLAALRMPLRIELQG